MRLVWPIIGRRKNSTWSSRARRGGRGVLLTRSWPQVPLFGSRTRQGRRWVRTPEEEVSGPATGGEHEADTVAGGEHEAGRDAGARRRAREEEEKERGAGAGEEEGARVLTDGIWAASRGRRRGLSGCARRGGAWRRRGPGRKRNKNNGAEENPWDFSPHCSRPATAPGKEAGLGNLPIQFFQIVLKISILIPNKKNQNHPRQICMCLKKLNILISYLIVAAWQGITSFEARG